MRNSYYNSSKLVRSAGFIGENEFVSALQLGGKDSMEVAVRGNSERMILTAVYDNLGKGASGAAIECLNLVLGSDPYLGLEL